MLVVIPRNAKKKRSAIFGFSFLSLSGAGSGDLRQLRGLVMLLEITCCASSFFIPWPVLGPALGNDGTVSTVETSYSRQEVRTNICQERAMCRGKRVL